MEKLDYWRLCDELNVIQAALLIVDIDPSSEDGAYADDWKPHEQPDGYVAAKTALCNAILAGRLPATVRRSAWERGWDEEPLEGEGFGKLAAVLFEHGVEDIREVQSRGRAIAQRGVIYRANPDWSLTTVRVEDLRLWLSARGVKTGFFSPQASVGVPDYLDPVHERYAPKLAASVRAWMAVDNPQRKSPKAALSKWLREHAREFGLSDDEGKPNEQGIDECAKVANWQPGGGAPKTPGA
jgi:hypothetical protein